MIMSRYASIVMVFVVILAGISRVQAVPHMINYQGIVEVDGEPFGGSVPATGYFRFALVNEPESPWGTLYWSNDGLNPPSQSVPVEVRGGHYSVLLGDTALTGMTSVISPSVFDNEEIYLAIWFNDGTHGFQEMSPFERITSTGFSVRAETAVNVINDDDEPDDDSEVPDYISINNGRLYAPYGPGNVGIGTTSPLARLHIEETSSNDPLRIRVSSSTKLIVDNDGNVGIGTHNPNFDLDVTGIMQVLQIVGNSGLGVLNLNADNQSSTQLSIDDGGVFLFNNGNVGIGTSSPTEKLHVAGNIALTGDIHIPSSGGALINSDDCRVFETWWNSVFGGYSAIHSGYAWDQNDEPLSVVAGANGIFFTKGDAAHDPFGETLADIDASGNMTVSNDATVENDLEVHGAYRGQLGPNDGAPFPRPAYNSGWVTLPEDEHHVFTHNLGGNPDNYVVDLMAFDGGGIPGGRSNYGARRVAGWGMFWHYLDDSNITVYIGDVNSGERTVRVRIWVIN